MITPSQFYRYFIGCEIPFGFNPDKRIMSSKYWFRLWLGAVKQQLLTWPILKTLYNTLLYPWGTMDYTTCHCTYRVDKKLNHLKLFPINIEVNFTRDAGGFANRFTWCLICSHLKLCFDQMIFNLNWSPVVNRLAYFVLMAHGSNSLVLCSTVTVCLFCRYWSFLVLGLLCIRGFIDLVQINKDTGSWWVEFHALQHVHSWSVTMFTKLVIKKWVANKFDNFTSLHWNIWVFWQPLWIYTTSVVKIWV